MNFFEPGSPIILVGAGIFGRRIMERIGEDDRKQVAAFADGNAEKVGTLYCGKPVISYEELAKKQSDYRIVLAVSIPRTDGLVETLNQQGIHNFRHIRGYITEGMQRKDFVGYPELAQFKNTHAGESCFVIGNGPSLRMEDLTALYKNKVFCFGSNKIFLGFDQTPWRPDVLCATDAMVLANNWQAFNQIDESVPTILLSDLSYSFMADEIIELKEKLNNPRLLFFHTLSGPYADILETTIKNVFLNDITKYLHTMGAVTITMILLAVYMGFTKINLLGADTTYTNPAHDDPSVQDHFIKGYFKAGEKTVTAADPEVYFRGYQFIEDASRKLGFRVFNATRGGALEVFERVDFDKLFPPSGLL